MSLHHFIATHREELIKRSSAKVAMRPSPPPSAAELEHGVPIFLSQLATTLEVEEQSDTTSRPGNVGADHASNEAISRSARLHGQDLLKCGFTIEQVVRDYGDVCQAVTEIALEQDTAITTTEFHTLNRCLDDAIAGAVTSWNEEHERTRGHGQSNSLKHELRGQLTIAIAGFEALRAGRVGAGGATAFAVGRCLETMLTLLQDSEDAK